MLEKDKVLGNLEWLKLKLQKKKKTEKKGENKWKKMKIRIK